MKAVAEERDAVTQDALRLGSTRSLRLELAADLIDRTIDRQAESC
jgi:hypothetical protein